MSPTWVTAFLDLTPETFDDELRFWSEVSGCSPSAPRGTEGQFTTLVPPTGDGHLRVQRLVAGPGRVHLDLHVAWPRVSADRARGLGAREVADLGYVVMRSPGGLPFCFVPEGEREPAPPVEWPGGHRSQVDQVCVDVPSELFDRELEFWSTLTGWDLSPTTGGEFRRLLPPAGQPWQLLVQRLGEPLGAVRAHLDLATTDRAAETVRHVVLGASEVAAFDEWTVLTDPAGSAYCITDREPR